MEDEYGMADLREYMNGGRPIFGSIRPELLLPATSHQQHQQRNLGPGHHHQYDMVMGLAQVPTTHHHHHHQHQHQHEFLTDSSTPPVAVATATATGATTSAGFMDQMEAATGGGGGGDGSARWPRQETLTLLEIRSRLDSKFKEANQKGPLWDEVSRIMSEEHGYLRTGKKCREKFENLYKYYKKTKEGKAGRQDGKHYRFFRQLEALYGETSNTISASASEARHQGSHFSYNPVVNNNQDPHNFHPYDSMSLSNDSSEELNTSSSDDMRSLKGKIKEFIDGQMRKLMEKQEEWLERMMKMIEDKEQERILREEEWRNQETIRMEREQEFWAKERAWIEARDAALMESIHKLSTSTSCIHNNEVDENWPECEVTRLVQLRTSMESRFQQLGIMSSSSRNDGDDDDDVLWEEIGAKMGIMGYEKSGKMCKNKWGSMNKNKKRKENSTSLSSQCYIDSNNFQYYEADHGSSSSCLRYLMGDHQHHQHHHHHQHHQNFWENYEILKLSKGGGDNR